MITFDIPVITPAQQLANLCFQMMEKTAALHDCGQFMSFHNLDTEQLRNICMEGYQIDRQELAIPAMGTMPARCFLVVSIRTRFHGSLHYSEVKLFSKDYEIN